MPVYEVYTIEVDETGKATLLGEVTVDSIDRQAAMIKAQDKFGPNVSVVRKNHIVYEGHRAMGTMYDD